MITKGRSPTMRHVSRTHRVALDWLFDRINLDSKILIRYIDTKHQLTDILTKGNFTRDLWNTLLHVFNISHFSSTCCAEDSSLISCPHDGEKDAGAKRRRKKCGKIEIHSDEHVLWCSDKFLILEKSGCIQKSEDTHSSGETRMQDEGKLRIRSVEFSSATERCIPWRCNGHSHGETWRYKVGIRDVDLSESETGSEEDVTGKPVAYKTAAEKPHAPSESACQGRPKAERIEWSHNLQVSPATIHHTESVFSIVRRIYGREHDDTMNDSDVNMAILGHISECHSSSSSSSWTRVWGEFTIREEKSLEQCGTVIPRNWKTDQWSKWNHWYKDYWFPRCHMDIDKLIVRTSLSVHQRPNPRILRLCALRGKNGTWSHCDLEEQKLNGIRKTITSRIWIESMECRRSSSGKNSQEYTALGLLEKIPKIMTDLQCEPENFKGRIIFTSMFTDIVWDAKGNKEQCEYNSQAVAEYARLFSRGHWSFLVPESEAVIWYFVPPVPLREKDRRITKQRRERSQYTSMAAMKPSSCFLRTVISANQLSIYGATAGLCDRSAQAHQGPEKPASPQHLENVEIPTVLSKAEKFYQWTTAVEKLTARIRPKIRAIVRRPEVMGLKLVEREQYFHTLETEEGQQMQHLCREYTLPRNDEGTRVRGWIRSEDKNRSRLEHESLLAW